MDSEIGAFTARAKSSVVLWNIIGAAMVFCAHYHTHTLMKNCQTTPVYTHPKPTGCLNYNHSMEKNIPKEMLDILDNSTGTHNDGYPTGNEIRDHGTLDHPGA